VWCNPPWLPGPKAKKQWLQKAVEEAGRDAVDTVTVLMPADPWTGWFQEYVAAAPVLCLVGPGRVMFERSDGDKQYGVVLAVYGAPPQEYLSALEDLGIVYERYGVDVE